jgi:hypothetical protein
MEVVNRVVPRLKTLLSLSSRGQDESKFPSETLYLEADLEINRSSNLNDNATIISPSSHSNPHSEIVRYTRE